MSSVYRAWPCPAGSLVEPGRTTMFFPYELDLACNSGRGMNALRLRGGVRSSVVRKLDMLRAHDLAFELDDTGQGILAALLVPGLLGGRKGLA